jgi:hypothetical protein
VYELIKRSTKLTPESERDSFCVRVASVVDDLDAQRIRANLETAEIELA